MLLRLAPSVMMLACSASPTPARTPPEASGPTSATVPTTSADDTAVASSTATSDPAAKQSLAPRVVAQPTAAPEVAAVHDKTPIEKELAHVAGYETLPSLTRLPDFLSVNDVIGLFGDGESHDYLRDTIHTQLSGGGGADLRGGPIDEHEDGHYVLWVHDNLQQAAAVYDTKGRRTDKKVFSRGALMVRDVLTYDTKKENANSRLELIVERITSMSVCCLPVSWEVYRVSAQGRLVKLLEFPKNYHSVGETVRYGFMHHFEFMPDNGLVITSVHPVSDQRYEFTFSRRTGRYTPTPKTASTLRAEQSKPHEELEMVPARPTPVPRFEIPSGVDDPW